MVNESAGTEPAKTLKSHSSGIWHTMARDIQVNKYIYLMLIPAVVFYLIFCYKPMYGAIIAFKDYKPLKGIIGSDWVGPENFRDFFSSPSFLMLFKNTLVISVTSLIFGFPAPILLALLLNEVRNKVFKSVTQSLTYIPHFISLVVVCGMIMEFTSSNGIISDFLALFGIQRQTMLLNPHLFVPIFVVSNIWQDIGWGSIIYLAALTSIDSELYEAARIDGAGRYKQAIHITLPGIQPTIIVLFILAIGGIMNVGFEKIMLLYNPLTYSTADVISTYVYRKGILGMSYSYSTAVGLFNSVINLFLLTASNWLCRKINHTSLW